MKSRFLLMCALFWVVFASCDKQDDQNSINGNGTILPISDVTYVHPLGDSFTVSYTSVADWTLSIGKDGESGNISSDKTSGKAGTTAITFTVEPNTDGTDNETVLTFKSGSKTDCFTISQNAVVFDVTINEAGETDDYETSDNKSIIFDWGKSIDDKGAKFGITSNIEWLIEVISTNSGESTESWYELKQGNDVISNATSCGSIILGNDNKMKEDTEFFLTASDYNLNDDTHPVTIVITPVRKDLEGNTVPYEELKHEINVSQEYLIFELRQNGNSLSKSNRNNYYLQTPFSELGNVYLEANKDSDPTALGVQIFDIIYEEGKVDVVNENWNGDHIPKQISDMLYDDKREDGRILRCRTMQLTVPDPNKDRFTAANEDPSAMSVSLPLSMNSEVIEGAKITLNYTQNRYVLDMVPVDDLVFGNSDTTVVKKVEIKTKGPWRLAKSGHEEAKWLDAPESGVGAATLELRVNEQNLLTKDKEAILKLSTDFEQDLHVADDITVLQKEFLFKLEPDDNYPKESIERLNTIESHTYSQKFVSSGAWTLKMNPDKSEHGIWVAVQAQKEDEKLELDEGSDTLKGGPGEWTISVGAKDANPYEEERKMIMTLTSDLHLGNATYQNYSNGLPKSFELIQKKYHFVLAAENENGSDPNNGVTVPAYKEASNEYSFKVQCGAPWRIIAKPKWVEVDPLEGDGTEEKVVKLTFENNTGENWDSPRDSLIKIWSYKKALKLPTQHSDDPDEESKEFSITQKAFVFEVTPSNSLGVIEALDTKSYELCTVKCTEEAAWRINKNSWVKIDQQETVGTKTTVMFDLENNGLLEPRSSNVEIVCDLICKTVPLESIKQGAYKWETDNKPSYSFPELPGKDNSDQFDLTCLGPWTTTVDYGNGPSKWIKVPESGNGSADSITFAFTVDNNVETSERSAVVTVKSEVGDHSTQFTVSQNDYQWNVLEVPDSETLNPLDTRNYNLSVQCSGVWDVKSTNTDFIKEPEFKCEGRDKATPLSFDVVKNYSEETLESTVSIFSNDNEKLRKEFTVTQNPYKFEYSDAPVDGKVAVLGGPYTVNVICSGTWEVDNLADFTAKFVESAIKSDDGRSLVIKVKPNYNPDTSYSGSVTIKTTDIPDDFGPRKKDIELRQDKYLWDMSSVNDTYEIPASAVSDTVLFTGMKSTGELISDVPSDKPWIRCNVDGEKLIISADEHKDTTKARDAKITVKSEHWEENNSLQKEFTVRQNAAQKK